MTYLAMDVIGQKTGRETRYGDDMDERSNERRSVPGGRVYSIPDVVMAKKYK
jgi:hypothetical protein